MWEGCHEPHSLTQLMDEGKLDKGAVNASVKRILAFENGEVTAENIPGGGCRFAVTLKTR